MVASNSMARWLILAAIIALAPSCAPRPFIAAARTGSLSDLQRYVEAAADRKQLNQSRTTALAEAVAEREIATASDDRVYERVAALGSCASELYWPLHRRAKGADDAAAAAALVLFETGLLDELPGAGLRGQSESGAWRAFATRLAVEPEQRPRVYEALVDPDRRVRLAAIKTIQYNPVSGDGRHLIEVARLDPEGSLRQAALTALGDVGDFESLRLARDFWDNMGEASRLAYVQALNAPLAWKRGGNQLLTRIMESNESLAGAVAASLLYGHRAPSAGFAVTRLLHALREGTLSEKLLALASLPAGDPEVQQAIRDMAKSNDLYLRTAALELILKSPNESVQAVKRLQTIAASKDADAYTAARILAARGDEPSIARVERQLSAPLAAERLGAARLLMKLKRWDAVARALTDDHPAVRLASACDVLAH